MKLQNGESITKSTHQSIIVKPSTINGVGVFATRIIHCGEIVVPWENTQEITQCELESLPQEERHFIDIQKGKILLVGKPERFINHSCDANTQPGNLCDIATRDIQAGEEITADYSHFYIPTGQFQCSCRSKKCRGVIRGASVTQ